MKIDLFDAHATDDAGEICFGLDRETDERSLSLFVKRFAGSDFLEILIPRLSSEDITSVIDFMTLTMKKYMSEEEYHEYFLGNDD